MPNMPSAREGRRTRETGGQQVQRYENDIGRRYWDVSQTTVTRGNESTKLLQIPLPEQTTPISKPQKQVHRRLLEVEVDELVEAYQAGATVYEFADRFHMHRSRISVALERRGMARRYRMVEGDRLQRAIQEYQIGKSVVSIGKELGVAGDTVRRAHAEQR
jgi:hypothetical protein